MNIVGQDKLVTELDKIFSIFEASEGTIKPHFILTSMDLNYCRNVLKMIIMGKTQLG